MLAKRLPTSTRYFAETLSLERCRNAEITALQKNYEQMFHWRKSASGQPRTSLAKLHFTLAHPQISEYKSK